MTKQPIWFSLFLVVVLLAGCGSDATPAPATSPAKENFPPAETEETTILRVAVSRQDQTEYDSLIDAFEAENPGTHIMTVSIEDTLGIGRAGMGVASWPDDAYLRLATAADVIGAVATRTAVQQGAILDLTQLFQADSSLKAEDFYPTLMDSVQWNGGIWSVPVEATYPMFYYNKSIFDAAGIAYPEPGWTWDDFLAAANALTIRDGDVVSQWGFVEQTFVPVTFVQAYGGLLFDPNSSPPTARLDSSEIIQAVRWYTDLFLTHRVAPYTASSETSGPGAFENSGMRLIQDGQAAMWYSTTGFGGMGFGAQRGARQQPQEETTGVAPFPVRDAGDHSNPAVVEGLSISAGTNKADLAWEWIRFVVQQRTERRGPMNLMTSLSVPALPSVAAASDYWENLGEESAAALQFAIEHAYVDTYDGTGYDTFTAAVTSVLDEGVAVETALATSQTTVESEIEEEVEAAPTPVSNLVVAEEIEKALDAGAVVITYGTSEGMRFGQQSLATLVTQFQEEHPGIIVEIQTPEGFRGQLDLAEMAAEYDCFQASPSFREESLAAIMNLEPFLAADASLKKEDFYTSAVEQFTYQGQMWGLPGSLTVSVMNYNKDLFDAAGIDYPSLDWTTSDFLETAVALTKGEGTEKQYGYVPSFSAVNDLVSMMDRLGVELLNESQDPPTLVFNSPEAIETVRWYTGLITQYQVTPEVEEDSRFSGDAGRENQILIQQGRAAMWMDSQFGGGLGRMAPGGGVGFGATQLNTGAAPLPAGSNSTQGSGFQSVSGYFISAETQAREACWTWITFLTEQSTVASGLPARRTVAESSTYRQQVGAELADAYLASVSSGNRPSFFQRLSEEGSWLQFATNWLSEAYDQIISNEATVEVALNDAQAKIDAYRDCMITQDAFDDPEAQRTCMQEVGGTTMMGP